jgi:hypothetical protein
MAKAQAGGNSTESKSNTSILTAIKEDCYPRFPRSELVYLEFPAHSIVAEWFLIA